MTKPLVRLGNLQMGKLSQGLRMTPQMQLAIKLLSLNRMELQSALRTELEANPLLEEALDDVMEEEPYAERHDDDDAAPSIEQNFSRPETLSEHLLWQIEIAEFNSLEKQIAIRLVGEMNDRGLLDSSEDERVPLMIPEPSKASTTMARLRNLIQAEDAKQESPLFCQTVTQIASELDLPVSWIESTRKKIMKLDPVGCLSLNIQECFLVQLEAQGRSESDLAVVAIRKHFEDVEHARWTRLCSTLHIEEEQLQPLIKSLSMLESSPSRAFYDSNRNGALQTILPDAAIIKDGDEYQVVSNDDGMPKLRLSNNPLLAQNRTLASNSYLKERLRSAKWIVHAIYQRQQTIHHVLERIVDHQRMWFEGTGPLNGLTLKTIADELGIHESTVSRATVGKYVATHKGIYELKYFFDTSISQKDGSRVSGQAIKDLIGHMLRNEDNAQPLSDQQLADKLASQGIKVARRTLSKYRESLKISAQHIRKR